MKNDVETQFHLQTTYDNYLIHWMKHDQNVPLGTFIMELINKNADKCFHGICFIGKIHSFAIILFSATFMDES